MEEGEEQIEKGASVALKYFAKFFWAGEVTAWFRELAILLESRV